MSNISDYDAKLTTVHMALRNITEVMVPTMSKVMPVPRPVINFVKDFMSMATAETTGLQEAAHEIVTNVGPVITDRVQCTWSSARPRIGLGFVTVAISVVAGWLML